MSNNSQASILLIDQIAYPTCHVVLKTADEGQRAYCWDWWARCFLLSKFVILSRPLGPLKSELSFWFLVSTAHILCNPMRVECAGLSDLRESLSAALVFGPLNLEPVSGWLSKVCTSDCTILMCIHNTWQTETTLSSCNFASAYLTVCIWSVCFFLLHDPWNGGPFRNAPSKGRTFFAYHLALFKAQLRKKKPMFWDQVPLPLFNLNLTPIITSI